MACCSVIVSFHFIAVHFTHIVSWPSAHCMRRRKSVSNRHINQPTAFPSSSQLIPFQPKEGANKKAPKEDEDNPAHPSPAQTNQAESDQAQPWASHFPQQASCQIVPSRSNRPSDKLHKLQPHPFPSYDILRHSRCLSSHHRPNPLVPGTPSVAGS